jgi:hypothetical protein
MKPHSFRSAQRAYTVTDQERLDALGPFAKRHGRFLKGTVLPPTQVVACPRVKMADMPKGFIPAKYYENNLEHNQQVASCCRHPENHEIEARKSHPDEETPDIYVFYCNGCKRKHVRWFVGETDDVARPIWEVA